MLSWKTTGNRQGALPGGPVTGPPGRHTKRGGYIIDDKKVRVFICPPPAVLESSPVSLIPFSHNVFTDITFVLLIFVPSFVLMSTEEYI